MSAATGGAPEPWTFASIWEEVAAAQSDAECLVQGERRLSWGMVDRRADALAGALVAMGTTHQSKVALYLYNCPEYLEATFACSKAGLVPVNTNFRYQPGELEYLWTHAEVEVVVFHASLAERITQVRAGLGSVRRWICVADGEADTPPWAEPYEALATAPTGDRPARAPWGRSPDDLFLLYTGGTTGFPKGVMWRQEDLFIVQNQMAELRYPLEEGLAGIGPTLANRRHPPPRAVSCSPLAHGTGAFSAYSVLSSGGTVVLLAGRRFSARELLDVIDRERVTQLAIVGDAFCRPITDELDRAPEHWDLSSLWLVVSSGMIWSEAAKAALLRHAPQVLCVDSLGSSEAIGVGRSRTRVDDVAAPARFSVGPGTQVIDDGGNAVAPGSGTIGRLAIRGRGPIGYYKDPEATERTFPVRNGERWCIPGDYARVEEDGSVSFIGRGSMCVNSGGEKVFVEEVEEALKRHRAVADAGVVGLPHERFGEMVAAAVELRVGAVADAEEIVAMVREQLADYKVPRYLAIVDSVGRSQTGKLDYPALRERLAARRLAERVQA